MTYMFQRFGWAVAIWAGAMLAPAQAGVITQQVEMTVVDAVDGNGFGVVSGWSDLVGSFTYDADAIDDFWGLTPEAGLFEFAINVGGTIFSESDDSLYPAYPFVVFADELAQSILTFDYEGSVGALTALIYGLGDGEIWFSGLEDGVEVVVASLSFSPTASVGEPSMWALVALLGLVPLARRRAA